MDGLNNQIRQGKLLAKLVVLAELQSYITKQKHQLELELAAEQAEMIEIERKEKERDQR
tara:strand:+ start:733 stop:909 length:177 start_codon:yes stop_codon:yes gene_type:complete